MERFVEAGVDLNEIEEEAFDLEDSLFDNIDEDFNIADVIKSDVEVEKIIKKIVECDEEVEFLKKLKKERTNPIDEKIDLLGSKRDKLKSFTLELMSIYFPEKNTVDFPGVAKISKRKNSPKWELTDEEKFISFVKDNKVQDGIVKTTESVVKKEIQKVVSELLKTKSKEEIVGAEYKEPEKEYTLVISKGK
jgi:hypothetical protein